MNYRKIKWMAIPLLVMFIVWWFASVWIYTRYPADRMNKLESSMSTGAGYNYMKAQILFSMTFVVTLFQLLPELGIQDVIKRGRARWVFARLRYIFVSAMYFAAIFILVEISLSIADIGIDFLIKYNYFHCMLLGWISLTFIYFFMGCLYLMFSVIFSAGLVALGASFIVSLVFMVASFYRNLPSVYAVMDVMQWPAIEKMGMGRFDIMFVVKPLVYNIVAMAAIIIVTIRVFRRKDLLDSSLQLI